MINKLKLIYHKWILTNLLRDKADIENYLNVVKSDQEAKWELKCINNSIRETNERIVELKK